MNPIFWLADLVNFIIVKDSISDKEIMSIFKKNKDNIIPNYDFHFASALYETDVWSASGEELSRVYCLPILEEFSKSNKKTIVSDENLKTLNGKTL